MKIALDYDGTYTLDSDFWDEVILLAKNHGHEIFFLTARYPHELITPHPDPRHNIPVVYTWRKAKSAFSAGADVFIDDNPESLLRDRHE